MRSIFITTVVLVILFVTVIAFGSLYLFLNLEIINFTYLMTDGFWILVLFLLGSIVIALLISLGISRLVLKPARTVITGIQKLSAGDFSARMQSGKPKEFNEIARSFNTLAEELEKTKILRSDFINNFSHEFKTPIVSVKGLLDLLKRPGLPESKRNEYLKIVEEEIDRLTDMATNVLNLSRIESQSILTDVTEFNISEQIRTCIVLLEKKWTKKQLDLSLDFDEYFYSGNTDMLKQVWINLADNAIKFSRQGGELKITMGETEEHLFVRIADTGETIPKDDFEKIFNKFYREDKSAMSEGNGIGLSIVSRIVKLHGGRVEVESENGVTAFTVFLKKGLN